VKNTIEYIRQKGEEVSWGRLNSLLDVTLDARKRKDIKQPLNENELLLIRGDT